MVTELRDGVWWYGCTGVNAYLVADGDGVTVVDTGTPFDAATVERAVEAAGFDLSAVTRILLTHYDVDHVGSAAKLAVDAPVYVGRDDAPFVAGGRPPLAGGKSLLQRSLGPFVPDVPDDRLHPVADGDEIGGFTAHHTPGHTPGHVAYVHEGREVALVGDLVVERGGDLRPSPWFMSYDADRVRASIDAFAAAAPDVEALGMGHGTPFERGGDDRLAALAESARLQ